MKPFDSLTDAELDVLTDDDLMRYVDFVCAEEGTPLLPLTAPTPPELLNLREDIELYHVGGLAFFEEKDANKVVDLLGRTKLARTDYIRLDGGYKTDYQRQTATHAHELPTVEVRKYWSAAHAAKHAERLTLFCQQKEQYEADKRAYDKISQRRAEIVRGFGEKVKEVQGRNARRRKLEEEFTRYLHLADRNEGIALRFLAKAHPDAVTVLAHRFEQNGAIHEDRMAEGVLNNLASTADNNIPF
jgi:hypothetical protein